MITKVLFAMAPNNFSSLLYSTE